MTNFVRRERPWGWYETIVEDEKYKVKRLWFNPNQRLSLQYHNLRTEDWVVVEGSGIITQNRVEIECKVGDTFHINVEMKHRAKGGPNGLMIIETQIGTCKEDDIIRIEDDYGRIHHKDNTYMCMNEYGTD